jgi:hypothetical protein
VTPDQYNLHLWMTNRAAWIEAAAPKCAEYLATGRAAIEHAWPVLARDFQLKVWPLLDETTRDLIRQVRA